MKKKQKKEMLNECLSDKGTAKLYIQFFRLKKKQIWTFKYKIYIRDFEAVQKNLQTCIIRTWKYTHAGLLNNT